MPGFAFLDQMWVAALVLGALVVVVSLWRPEADESAGSGEIARSLEEAGRTENGSDRHVAEDAAGTLPRERDLLFDALCVGVVVLTIGLYVIFF